MLMSHVNAIAQLMSAERVYVDASEAEVQPSWWPETARDTIARLRTLDGSTHTLEALQRALVDDGDPNAAALAVHALLVQGVATVIPSGTADDVVTVALIAGEHDEHQEYVEAGDLRLIPRWDGGLNLTLRFDAELHEGLRRVDVRDLSDLLHTLVRAQAHVSGCERQLRPGGWAVLARDLEALRVEVAEVQAAVIRAHTDAGGGLRGLARVMDMTHSTVQRRRDAALQQE